MPVEPVERVADEADGVEGFARRPCGNRDAFTLQRSPAPQRAFERFEQTLLGGQTPQPLLALGEKPALRSDDFVAARLQGGKIGLRCRVFVHRLVHGRR